jgi:hypothetical protein
MLRAHCAALFALLLSGIQPPSPASADEGSVDGFDGVPFLLSQHYVVDGRVTNISSASDTIGWVEFRVDSILLGTIPQRDIRFDSLHPAYWRERGLQPGDRVIGFSRAWSESLRAVAGNLFVVHADGSVGANHDAGGRAVVCGGKTMEAPNSLQCLTSELRRKKLRQAAEWLQGSEGIVTVRIVGLKAGGAVTVEQVGVILGRSRQPLREVVIRGRAYCSYVPAIGDTLVLPAGSSAADGKLEVEGCAINLVVSRGRLPALGVAVRDIPKRFEGTPIENGLKLRRVWNPTGGTSR